MTYREAYYLCKNKAHLKMKQIKEAGGELYEYVGCADGKYEKLGQPLQSYWNWLASMITGTAPIMFETEGDFDALVWANSFKDQYRKKVTGFGATAIHDMGFLYLPYSVYLYRLTGDTDHRDIAINAADILLKRYHIEGEFIESLDDVNKPDCEGLLIIDTLMNVPLLLWAWKETGFEIYHEVAIKHIETTIKTVVRDDYSVCQAYVMGLEHGRLRGEENACGYGNGSHWARGTAWMVYGLVAAYDYTGCERYLDLAEKIGNKFIDCLTEEDYIPVWDFRLPKDEPATKCKNTCTEDDFYWDETLPENKKYNRDTSAAAIMCCAFQSFCRKRENKNFSEATEKMLTSLCNKYLSTDENIPGMLTHSNGQMVFTTYGDYYFFAALAMHEFGINGAW